MKTRMSQSSELFRYAATGFSMKDDSFEAGHDAATDAVRRLGRKPHVLLVFSAMRYDHRSLLKGIAAVVPATPLVGGTTAGEISMEGATTQSVVVMALASDRFRFYTGVGRSLSRNERQSVGEMLDQMFSGDPPADAQTLLVFPDGMGGDGLRLMDGLHERLGGKFEIVGGYPGDDERFKQTYQYHDGQVYQDAIAGLLICHDEGLSTGIGVRSGFESIGNSFVCTSAEGNVVREFDHVRSLDLYREFLGEERSARLPGAFMEYPFGLIDEGVSSGKTTHFQLRCGVRANEEDGSIFLAASIPEGSEVTLTTGSRGDVIRGAHEAARQALKSLGGAKPEAIIMFSCVGRKMVLGRRVQEEVNAVRECIGRDVPIVGFYTYGEIGPIDKTDSGLSAAKFHNETVVLWVLGAMPE